MASPPERPTRWHSALLLLLIGLSAVGLLAMALRSTGVQRLHVSFLGGIFNDQVAYLTTARSLAETGHILPHILYTSALWLQPSIRDHHLYMPGYFVVLAAAVRLFGYRVAAALLPSLLGYLLTGLSIGLITRRLVAPQVALPASLFAALLFLLLPMTQVFAASAMMELTFLGVSTGALCAFIYLPERARLALGPLLLALPFLVRDTGAFLVAPMALILLMGERGQHSQSPAWRRAGIFCVCAVLLLGALWVSPLCRPRITLAPGLLLDGSMRAIYEDSVAQRALALQLRRTWPDALLATGKSNLHNLVALFKEGGIESQTLRIILALAAGSAACLARKRPLALGALAVLGFTLLLMLFLYHVRNFAGVRLLLLSVPLCAVALAQRLSALRPRALWALIALLLCCAPGSVLQVQDTFAEAAATDKDEDEGRRFLESLGHNDQDGGLLIAPVGFSLDYLWRHYPTSYAFMPANPETLQLLLQRHRIGTMVVPRYAPPSAATARALMQAGLRTVAVRRFRGQDFEILRPQPSPPGAAGSR